jgi:aminopeptidase N
VDPDSIHLAHEALTEDIGKELREILLATYRRLAPEEPYSPDSGPAGRRALRNSALAFLAAGSKAEGAALAIRQFESASTMTDKFAALCVLSRIGGKEREEALQAFYAAYENEALVIDKWFAVQAAIPERGTLDRVKALMQHKAFSYKNPNRLRALAGSFAAGNPTQFNAADGSGYDFIAGIVLDLDAKNPQVAARLLSAFKSWRILEPRRRALAQNALQHVAGATALSADVKDIAERSLST